MIDQATHSSTRQIQVGTIAGSESQAVPSGPCWTCTSVLQLPWIHSPLGRKALSYLASSISPSALDHLTSLPPLSLYEVSLIPFPFSPGLFPFGYICLKCVHQPVIKLAVLLSKASFIYSYSKPVSGPGLNVALWRLPSSWSSLHFIFFFPRSHLSLFKYSSLILLLTEFLFFKGCHYFTAQFQREAKC